MKTKITGMVTILTRNKIRIFSNRRHIWEIKRTPKPKVISGTLRLGSTVTVEFNKADGKDLGGPQPGRRTETGTVIKLTGTQITLDNTTPDPKTWTIQRTSSTEPRSWHAGGWFGSRDFLQSRRLEARCVTRRASPRSFALTGKLPTAFVGL